MPQVNFGTNPENVATEIFVIIHLCFVLLHTNVCS